MHLSLGTHLAAAPQAKIVAVFRATTAQQATDLIILGSLMTRRGCEPRVKARGSTCGIADADADVRPTWRKGLRKIASCTISRTMTSTRSVSKQSRLKIIQLWSCWGQFDRIRKRRGAASLLSSSIYGRRGEAAFWVTACIVYRAYASASCKRCASVGVEIQQSHDRGRPSGTSRVYTHVDIRMRTCCILHLCIHHACQNSFHVTRVAHVASKCCSVLDSAVRGAGTHSFSQSYLPSVASYRQYRHEAALLGALGI